MDPVPTVSSPPPSPRVTEVPPPDARDRLHSLAQQLLHSRNAQLLREYLMLRARLR